jgi:DMSO/TMAO reductase YedYZ molybdopterin-dependent catalytic subunit
VSKTLRLLLAISIVLLAASASLFVWRYAGADSEKVLRVEDIRSWPASGGSYRSINNWQTVQVTSFKGVRVSQLLGRCGVKDGDASIKFIAPDGYFWPKVGTTMTLAELSRPNQAGLYPIIAFELEGKALDPEPDGSGPLRFVSPQYSPTEKNKPSWVSNVRLVEAGPLKKGIKKPDARKVPTDQLWVYGDIPASYPVGLLAPLLTGLIGLVVLAMALIYTRIGRKKKSSGERNPLGAILAILLLAGSVVAFAQPQPSQAQQGPAVFSKGDLASMPSVSAHYTFLKSKPPYTYYEENYTGVPLSYLLTQKLLLQPGASQVIVKAKDGYYTNLSLQQVNASYPGGLKVIVAYAKSGQPLVGDEGPLRLIVPQVKPGNRDNGGDSNTPACVRMVYAVEVQPVPAGVSAPDPASVPDGSLIVYGAVSTPTPPPAPAAPAPAPQPAQPPAATPAAASTAASTTPVAQAPVASSGNAALDVVKKYFGDPGGFELAIAGTALFSALPRPAGITMNLAYWLYRLGR